jgi:hypothetical protein
MGVFLCFESKMDSLTKAACLLIYSTYALSCTCATYSLIHVNTCAHLYERAHAQHAFRAPPRN